MAKEFLIESMFPSVGALGKLLYLIENPLSLAIMTFLLPLCKKKLLFLLVLAILGQSLHAQTFTKELLSTPYQGVFGSSIAFSDVDGDGDEDFLIAGATAYHFTHPIGLIAKLYLNDGVGTFTESTALVLEGVHAGSLAFADVDADGDEDVLITGSGIAKLYLNDGMGNFFEVMGTPFMGVSRSAIVFADMNGDGEEDVLITGRDSSFIPSAKLYLNDGTGSFSEAMGLPFSGVFRSALAVSDIDGDGDQDVLITGEDSAEDRIASLYTNDGAGTFSLVSGTPFEGVFFSSVAFSDVDADGDEDVLITGQDSANAQIAKLYTNDGSGNFSEAMGTPFESWIGGSIAFSDVDGDGDEDVLISGSSVSGSIATLYTNDGAGNFSEATGTTFIGGFPESIAFSDVDGDGDQDVLITGGDMYFSGFTTMILHINDGTGHFQSPFEGVGNGTLTFSDIDGDGDEDVLITGNGYSSRIAKLYTNDGSGSFSPKRNTPFQGVQDGSVAFSDVDGDGDEDVLITGWDPWTNDGFANLSLNDGLGNFSEAPDTAFEGVAYSALAFRDVDGDGDEDVFITGRDNSSDPIAKLYINDGTGDFTERTSTLFEGVEEGAVAFSDVDGDGDQDVLITGMGKDTIHYPFPYPIPIAKLYLNNGIGYYVEASGPTFEAVSNSAHAFSDIDNDGDEDVLITGTDSSAYPIAKLYLNDGLGNFSELTATPFEGLENSAFAFIDIDGDGDEDVFITGQDTSTISTVPIAKLYLNDGLGNFSELSGTTFEALWNPAFAFADVDGDGDEDVLMTGGGIANLYLNEGLQTSIAESSVPDRFGLVVFPNPVSEHRLNIRALSKEERSAIVSVFDLSGRLVIQQREVLELGEETLVIDISTLSTGSYIIRMEDGIRQGVGTFVVR